jgi:ribonucleotide monophosphatase NagD (HAD superfamily)
MKLQDRPKTILCDIDGTLIKHCGDICNQHLVRENVLLDKTLDKLREWDLKGYKIILITGRRESTRAETEKQLSHLGIIYDQLVMGVTGGIRVLINDTKPNDDTPTSIAVNVKRNQGIGEINV